MVVAHPMTMQGGAAGLQQQQQQQQAVLFRSSYLGLQLASQSGVAVPCGKLSSSFNLRCQVSPSSTTLSHFNVDISGVFSVSKPLSSKCGQYVTVEIAAAVNSSSIQIWYHRRPLITSVGIL